MLHPPIPGTKRATKDLLVVKQPRSCLLWSFYSYLLRSPEETFSQLCDQALIESPSITLPLLQGYSLWLTWLGEIDDAFVSQLERDLSQGKYGRCPYLFNCSESFHTPQCARKNIQSAPLLYLPGYQFKWVLDFYRDQNPLWWAKISYLIFYRRGPGLQPDFVACLAFL